jgi:Met-zincin/Domain of unknown function (DUF5117)
MKLSRVLTVVGLLLAGLSSSQASAADYPPFDKVIEGFKKIEPPTGEPPSMYTVYTKEDKGLVLLELPKNYESKKYFIGLTVASGQIFAGLQAGDFYVQWREYNGRLALIEPNVRIRSGGDSESKDSVNRLFTGRVLTDSPIITLSPRGGPVIDGRQLLVNNASVFFGASGRSQNPSLAKIVKAKAFPKNIELAFEMPNMGGNLNTLYYSISEIPEGGDYRPRVADQRIGYFTTSYSDYGKYKRDDVSVNYINRWHLKKRDPSLKVSPPVEPITFYIEHTTPVRYRRWVKQGIDHWNDAFEKVGLSEAIVVHYQDKSTGAHMEKDPEDVRYNFIRWLNNNVGTAIGPSRVHPETGQILDADVVLTDGWIRHFNQQFGDFMPILALEGMDAEARAWLAENPSWDPRVRFADGSRRRQITNKLQAQTLQDFDLLKTRMIGDEPLDGLLNRTSQVNGMCLASEGKRMDTSMMRMLMELGPAAFDETEEEKKKKEAAAAAATPAAKPADEGKKEEPPKTTKEEAKEEKKPEPKKPEESLLDGMPENFIGPLLADLVAHEVGHTLGLRHNFKASSIYTLDEINSDKVKGKALASSVMDYLPINLRVASGQSQGDYTMVGLGPYDVWAIEYGYTFEKDLAPILARASEPQLQYSTDEDTTGPDPLARRYDFSKNPLDFAKEQAQLIERFRKKLMDDYVKKGDSWTKAREGYELTLSLQSRNTSMMSNWVGGAFVTRDKKGDSNERAPITVVPKFVLETTFRDVSYALSPELLSRLTRDFMDGQFGGDPTWPVHDRILSMQSSTLTQLMNPSTLRRVYDNEFRVATDQDAVTLPELLNVVSTEIWSELDLKPEKKFSDRQPMISSLRRNLQNEHMKRLIDLMLPGSSNAASTKAISNLSVMQLKQLKSKIEGQLNQAGDSMDAYTKAHLYEAGQRMGKALEATYVYNQSSGGGLGGTIFLFGEPAAKSGEQAPSSAENFSPSENP